MSVSMKAMLQQIQTALLAAKWPGGNNVVFGTGSVIISRYVPEQTLTSMRVPIAQIMPGDFQSDPQYDEEPDLWVASVIVRIIVNIPGDNVGINPLVGANRPDVTKSEGAGLLDVEGILYSTIGRLNVADNANFAMQFRQKGVAGGIHVDGNRYWAYADHRFEAIATPN